MNKRIFIPIALVIIGLLMTMIGPFVIVNNHAIPTYFALFCTKFSLINVIFILGYVSIIAGLLFYLFKDKKDTFVYNSLFLFLIAGFIFAFSAPLMQFILEEEIVFISASPILLSVFSFGFFVFILATKKEITLFTIRDIVEIAMLVSIAVILDMFLKIKIGATGGSINLSMLPLMIIALRHNFYKSFIGTGIVYGLTTCLTDGYGLMYLPFDYVLGFGSVAIISLFRSYILSRDNKILIKGVIFLLLSCIAVFIARTLASTISSMVYYGYTFSAGIIYNVAYIGPSVGACFIALLLLYQPIVMINRRYPTV